MAGLIRFPDLEYLCETIPSAAIVITPDYRVAAINKSAETLFTVGRHEILGHNIENIIDSAQLSLLPLRETLATGAAHTGIEKTFQHQGLSFQAMVDLLPLLDAEKRIAGALAIIKDLTNGHEVDQRLRRLELLAGVGQMAAGIIHEIRNPLTSINGFVQLLQVRATQENDATSIGYCKLIINEIAYINNILSDFLSLAKPQERKIAPLDIVQLVQDVSSMIYGEALLFQTKLVNNLPDKPLYIRGNSEKIKEVLINICRNAFQAMTPGGVLTTTITGSAGNIRIDLSDTGHGMTADTITNIFKPFFSTKETGTGLGLAICQRIIGDHQGEIKVKSDLGQGTTFSLIFPRHHETGQDTALVC